LYYLVLHCVTLVTSVTFVTYVTSVTSVTCSIRNFHQSKYISTKLANTAHSNMILDMLLLGFYFLLHPVKNAFTDNPDLSPY
jgi:hypothetical protein